MLRRFCVDCETLVIPINLAWPGKYKFYLLSSAGKPRRCIKSFSKNNITDIRLQSFREAKNMTLQQTLIIDMAKEIIRAKAPVMREGLRAKRQVEVTKDQGKGDSVE